MAQSRHEDGENGRHYPVTLLWAMGIVLTLAWIFGKENR